MLQFLDLLIRYIYISIFFCACVLKLQPHFIVDGKLAAGVSTSHLLEVNSSGNACIHSSVNALICFINIQLHPPYGYKAMPLGVVFEPSKKK